MTNDDRISILEHLGKVMDLRFASLDKEMTLYREEVEKRLKVLNDHEAMMRHVREDAERKLEKMLPRETFETWTNDRMLWRDQVNRQLTTIETRTMTWGAALAIFITVLTLALHFWGAVRP